MSISLHDSGDFMTCFNYHLEMPLEIKEQNMNNVCRFSRDHIVECSERTVLSCLEPVCLCWRRFGKFFSHHLAKSDGWPADFMH